MKLRFRKNTLRLRVNQLEVQALASGAVLEERVVFPGQESFSYSLQVSSQDEPSAGFQQGVIRVLAPHMEVSAWANSDALGIYFDLPADGAALKVAIEKDLECVEGALEERDPDAFPRRVEKSC
jgi:hypothetical protein